MSDSLGEIATAEPPGELLSQSEINLRVVQTFSRGERCKMHQFVLFQVAAGKIFRFLSVIFYAFNFPYLIRGFDFF